jgi:hypothetical protein
MWLGLLSISLALSAPLGLWFVLLTLALALSVPLELAVIARWPYRQPARDFNLPYPGL